MKKKLQGLVIGKFLPPHRGHKYLIEYALDHADKVDVLICDSPTYAIDAQTRKRWLQEIHPAANVRIIPDLGKDDDSLAWARHTAAYLGYTPDVVFSSESYGDAYARYMGSRHVMVDQYRLTVPISATKIRSNIFGQWQYLEPIVRQDLAIRIVIVGAESTGTTTLSQDLAAHYTAPWAPEFGRLYSEALLHAQHQWFDDDFAYIAANQQQLENKLARQSNGLLICDTNASATQFWQKRYVGHLSTEVATIAARDKVDYYLLTGDEIPFVQDGTRDGEHIRHNMHQEFDRILSLGTIPYKLLSGSRQERLGQATQLIDNLLSNYHIADPTPLHKLGSFTGKPPLSG